MSPSTNPLAWDGSSSFLVPSLAVTLVLLLGIILNLRARRRERTNPKCALAVVFALLGGASLYIGALLLRSPGTPEPLRPIPGFIAVAFVGLSAIMAGLGLGELKKFPGRFDRGRRRAIAVLAFPVVLSVLIVTGVIAHSTGHPIFSTLIRGTAGTSITDVERNYRLMAPPPWVQIDGTTLLPEARAGLARSNPSMNAVVLSGTLVRLGAADLTSAVAIVKAQIAAVPAAQFLAENEQPEGGIAGRRLESITTFNGTRVFQVHWLAENSGLCHQLVVWGPESVRGQILAEARKLAAGFRVLDPNLHPVEKGAPAPTTYTSQRFGYSVDLTDTAWNRRWPEFDQEVPFSEFGVLNTTGSAAFHVIPVWIGDDQLDLDILTAALTARLGVPFTPATVFGLRDLRQGPLRGRAFSYELTQEKARLLYRFRILRGRGYAYLLVALLNKERESSAEFLDLALSCVSFPEQVEPEPLILGDRPRARHSLVWNDIGTGLLRAGQTAAALPWFRRAYEVERSHLPPLENYAAASITAGRAPEALAYVEKQLVDFPDSADLQRLRTQLRDSPGKRE